MGGTVDGDALPVRPTPRHSSSRVCRAPPLYSSAEGGPALGNNARHRMPPPPPRPPSLPPPPSQQPPPPTPPPLPKPPLRRHACYVSLQGRRQPTDGAGTPPSFACRVHTPRQRTQPATSPPPPRHHPPPHGAHMPSATAVAVRVGCGSSTMLCEKARAQRDMRREEGGGARNRVGRPRRKP